MNADSTPRAQLIHIDVDRRLGHEWDEWDGRPLPGQGNFDAPPALFFAWSAGAIAVATGLLALLLFLLAPRLALLVPALPVMVLGDPRLRVCGNLALVAACCWAPGSPTAPSSPSDSPSGGPSSG